MLLVDTELRPSRIHGTGVFLLEPVRRGQLIWRFDPRFDQTFAGGEVRSMPDRLRRFVETYCTYHAGEDAWVLCGDNGRFFNHSDRPNTQSLGIAFGDDVAAEDLPAGTELTTDYRTICDAARLNGSLLASFAGPSPRRGTVIATSA